MPLSDLSPLSYFKELHLLPRVVFTIGGVLFFTGLFRDWKISVAGAGLLFVAVGYNFLTNLMWHDPSPPYPAHISWPNLFQGLVSMSIGLLLLYVSVYTYRHAALPVLLRPL